MNSRRWTYLTSAKLLFACGVRMTGNFDKTEEIEPESFETDLEMTALLLDIFQQGRDEIERKPEAGVVGSAQVDICHVRVL